MLIPDFEIWIKEYQNKIYRPEVNFGPDLPNENYVDTFVASMYYHDHFYLHNFNTMKRALKKAGFSSIRECELGDTKIISARLEILKAEVCKLGSIIIEAEKSDEEPQVKKFCLLESKNLVKKMLARCFNIKITPFKRNCPMFPSKWWFREKMVKLRQGRRLASKGLHTGSKHPIKQFYENKLDLKI